MVRMIMYVKCQFIKRRKRQVTARPLNNSEKRVQMKMAQRTKCAPVTTLTMFASR